MARRGSQTSEYIIWKGMIARCENKSHIGYCRYGKIGVVVCKKWRESFVEFIKDVGLRPSKSHSIDRYPNRNGNYEPGNVRWATWKEQMRNTSANRIVEVNGVKMCLSEAAESAGVNRVLVRDRLKSGMTIEQAIRTPINYSQKIISFRGKSMNLSAWSIATGLSVATISRRINSGMSVRETLTKPSRNKKKK